ncbi:branched-chain amino acid ABC transporter permease [Acuticoccus sp. MNP-M23]|uniref:branched-chain amino acid ABC transporter permease n=1 Tax=Acuticoccus sp. MNP-M23 TaxID=3072793 RepID=UPI0028151EF3|nr:branched-chain amino acid ABC transporter permease [Acuticoccus sp. MNP-M23]WMS43670.1 branched-chain amino acid ABC transporter permease [Acuticoccus sp. MNP-M23]
MNSNLRSVLPFIIFFGLVALTGIFQSWSFAFSILNMCLVSAVMALGINMQWGYAGLVNFGVMGFTALGGLAVVLVASEPVPEAWAAGGHGVLLTLLVIVGFAVAILALRRVSTGFLRGLLTVAGAIAAFILAASVLGPATEAIEDVDPSFAGFLGGAGLPVLLSWIVGGLFAAAAAFVIGKIALGLRADYLAIATLGVSEIIIAALMNEDWMARGVKNVVGLPRPVPYEVELREEAWFADLAASLPLGSIELSSLVVKLGYIALFVAVLGAILWLAQKALVSPWGRMMRAVRDNETAAGAMGKDVKKLHLLVFVIGSGVIGVAGAMLTTLDGQFTPGSYQPLRFTFLIWVMVIVGGSGNNWGATIGAFVVWFTWVQAEPMGTILIDNATFWLGEDSPVRNHLLDNAAQMRLVVMGVVLLLVLRFAPRGIIPEAQRR